MENVRTYGKTPYKAALLHGGPGAAGDLKPVAEELSKHFGVLEPYQTKHIIDGQVKELHSQLSNFIKSPITLIGHSWGGWLAFIFAAEYPDLVNKLILVSSGPFEEKYTAKMMEERVNHLNHEDKLKYFKLIQNSGGIMSEELGNLLSKADSYELIPGTDNEIEFNPELHLSVWTEAKELRRSGKFLNYGYEINCPVIAIHGDFDTHPIEGVTEPLSKVLNDFKMIILEKCGHTPWRERYARDKFFEIIVKEISEK